MIGKIFSKLSSVALILGAAAQVSLIVLPVYGDEVGEPYIDHLKKENPALTPTPEVDNQSPYIDSLKTKMKKEDESSQPGYTERIKKELEGGKPNPEASTAPSYTEDAKGKLGPEDEGSAIADVQQGHSSLKYEKRGEIHNTFGLEFGVGLARKIDPEEGVGTSQSFSGIYGANYAPDIALYYEYQLFRGYIGNFGLFGMAEVGIFKGLGTFQVVPNDPITNQPQSATSGVQFTFVEVPAVVGIDYRFSLFKYVQPFVMAGPNLIGGVETRNDGNPNHWVLSYGGYSALGVSFLMDWISQHDDWDRYAELNIKHTYLNVEYSDLHSIGGAVSYNVSGPYLGVTFEF